MPTIRIDEEVWTWLKKHARPLEDTPNTVLRRIAALDPILPSPMEEEKGGESIHKGDIPPEQRSIHIGGRKYRRDMSGLTGRQLNDKWNVGAKHALYHKDGNYYNLLKYFPGALFDPEGYVLFKTEKDYVSSSFLQHGQQLHVPGGISSMPNYVRVK